MCLFVFMGQTPAQESTSGWQADPDVVATAAQRRGQFNYKEAKVPDFELPDPLRIIAPGATGYVSDAETWRTRQRPALLDLFRRHVYGVRPDTAYEIGFAEVGRIDDAFGIGATGRRIRATIDVADRSHSFDFVLFTPRADREVPILVLINNRYFTPLEKAVEETDPFWPVETILRSGFATAAFHTSDVDPDRRDGYDEGIRSLLDASDSDPETRWKSLSAWGWAASRVLDFASRQPGIDADATAVIGHSRGGKAALWAAAEDERFRIAYSNDSGCGGAALSRRALGETVAQINRSFPHWFCDRFKKYSDRVDDLPVDQHQLIALLAPRSVYVASADEDLWADPKGEYASVSGAGPVFELFGIGHITDPDMPPLDQPRHVGATGYHIRSGGHNLTEQDWGYFLEFADSVFR